MRYLAFLVVAACAHAPLSGFGYAGMTALLGYRRRLQRRALDRIDV